MRRKRGKQKEALTEYANRLKEKLRNIEGNTLTLAKATQFVKELPGFEDTLEVQRFATKGRYIKFFRLFDFTVEGASTNIKVGLPKAKPASSGSASSGVGRETRPTQAGSASSGSASLGDGLETRPIQASAPPKKINYLSALLEKEFKK